MDVVVVGGGAAGLVAAWRAAVGGHRVRLVEGGRGLGAKLLITGGGRCNLTHAGASRELLSAFPKGQSRFLRPAFHAFSGEDLRALFRRLGLETAPREDGRVFPARAEQGAAEVVACLEGLVRQAGVELHLGTRVTGLEGAAPRLTGLVLASGERLCADAFILATGGASYPGTGSTGEGLTWLRRLGLPVVPWHPALAPVSLEEARPQWEGISLRGGMLVMRAGRSGKRLAAASGDLVFTRRGVSGPAVLELSAAIELRRRAGDAWLSYQPLKGEQELEAELLAVQAAQPLLQASTWAQRHLPQRMVPWLLEQAGLPPGQRMGELPRAGRRALVASVSAFPLGRPLPIELDRGEVTAGGLALGAVDPHSMAVQGWDNLRVCGELLDLDGPVGGYNLQAAFSTGYLAGSLS
nr:aminoacetone oxidase family FAD-binding enzyme [uncultured Holophaga sp.]